MNYHSFRVLACTLLQACFPLSDLLFCYSVFETLTSCIFFSAGFSLLARSRALFLTLRIHLPCSVYFNSLLYSTARYIMSCLPYSGFTFGSLKLNRLRKGGMLLLFSARPVCPRLSRKHLWRYYYIDIFRYQLESWLPRYGTSMRFGYLIAWVTLC